MSGKLDAAIKRNNAALKEMNGQMMGVIGTGLPVLVQVELLGLQLLQVFNGSPITGKALRNLHLP